jgi:hypothetical protein
MLTRDVDGIEFEISPEEESERLGAWCECDPMTCTVIKVTPTSGTVHISPADQSSLAPEIVVSALSDVLANVGGVNAPYGRVPGFGFIQNGSNPSGVPMLVLFMNKGQGVQPDARSVLLRVYGYQNAPQGCDQGLEFLTATGTFDQPSAVHAGDRLGKVVGMGHNGDGYYPNESAGIGFWADQDFAPVGPQIRAGGSVGFSTCDENTNTEVFRGYYDSRGNLYLGNSFPFGHAWPVKGAIIIKDCVQAPTQAIPGHSVFFSQNGVPKVMGGNGTITTLGAA